MLIKKKNIPDTGCELETIVNCLVKMSPTKPYEKINKLLLNFVYFKAVNK